MEDSIKIKKIRLIVFYIHFLSVMSANITGSILPDIALSLKDHFTNAELYAKLIQVSSSLGTACMALFVSSLDRKFERYNIINYSVWGFAICNLLCALVTSYHLTIFFRFVTGVSGSIMCILSYSNVYEIKNKEEKIKTFAMISIVINVVYALSPTLGAFFSTFVKWQFLYIIPCLLSIISIFIIDKEVVHSSKVSEKKQINILKIFSFELILTYLVILIVYTNVYYIVLKVPFLVKENIPSVGKYGISFLIIIDAITCIIVATQQTKISKTFSKNQLTVNAFICLTISYLLMYYGHQSYLMYSFAMIFSIVMSIPCVTNAAASLDEMIPKNFISMGIGAFCFTIFIASFFSGFYGIALTTIAPKKMPLLLSCACSTLFFSLVFYIYNKKNKILLKGA